MMKVTCNHCGAKNDLGRIFCQACGKRMTITTEDVSKAQAKHRAFNVVSLFKPLLLTLVLVVVGLAAWPKREPAGGDRDRNLMRARAEAKKAALLTAVRGRREGSVAVEANELSAYLRSRPTPADSEKPSLSASIRNGRLAILEEAKLGPYKVGSRNLSLPFTREIVLEPSGRAFKVQGAFIGHLPLGPLKGLVAKPLKKALTPSATEQLIEKQLTGMAIKDGKLEITVGP